MNIVLSMGKIKGRLLLAGSMILLALIVILLISALNSDSPRKILIDYGTEYYPFTIQNAMWIFFFLAIGELIYRFLHTRYTLYTLSMQLLPEKESVILTKDDTKDIYRRVRKLSRLQDDLPALLKKLVLHFQSTSSIARTQELFDAQMDLKYNRMESDYSMIDYLTWVIPTFGFIGTVMGISMALSFAAVSDPEAADFLKGLTQKLGVAFYTTLVALLMSAILVFLRHIVESYEEGSLFRLEEYVLDNFINRLYQR
jgi:biopolymer transport protein ExbB/TolQ